MRINQEKNFNLNTTLTGVPSNTLNFKQINKFVSFSQMAIPRGGTIGLTQSASRPKVIGKEVTVCKYKYTFTRHIHHILS